MMAKNKKPNNASSRSRKPKAATIPNLYWRGITMDQLREQERVIGLPHVADSEVLGRQSQRWVETGNLQQTAHTVACWQLLTFAADGLKHPDGTAWQRL